MTGRGWKRPSLDELEGELSTEGLETFVRVANALMQIDAFRYYRQRGYTTFSQYCETELGFERPISALAAVEVAAGVAHSLRPPTAARKMHRRFVTSDTELTSGGGR